MTRSIAAWMAAAVVATLLAAAFLCPTAAAALYATPTADVQIVGLPEQVYAGGESFFIVVLANDQPFFDESLDEVGVEVAAGVVPVEEWNATFGGADDNVAYSVQQTTDSGYIVAGETRSYGAGDFDAWLINSAQKPPPLTPPRPHSPSPRPPQTPPPTPPQSQSQAQPLTHPASHRSR